MEPVKKKKGNIFLKIFIGFLVLCGIFFIILMLLPEDESDTEAVAGGAETVKTETAESEVSKKENNSPAKDIEAQSISVGTDAQSATVMVYMNGSDLESVDGQASVDISEMLDSGIGENANVIIQTMGTKKWHDHGISSKTAQTFMASDGELILLRDDLGQLDCTSPETLSEFINYCKSEYPADRYICIFWDHGGGPVFGFGYDEWRSEEDSLTLAEMHEAFSENDDIHFDIIGMDCCIMGSMETCYALAPFCKYALLSEDFESGIGWSYTKWMRELEENPGISTPVLGKYIVDSVIDENEEVGESSCMALFNESTISSLFSAWKDYAYLNEDSLLNNNFSTQHMSRGKGFWDSWGNDQSDVTLSDYYISDMLAIVESVDSESEQAKKLMSALKACVAYYGHTSDKNELTGIAVSLPYGDNYLYDCLMDSYGTLGFDEDYLEWLGRFVDSSADDHYDYSDFEDSWNGWADYEQDYGCSGGSCANSWFYDNDGSYSESFSDSSFSDYYDYSDGESNDDWLYDYENELWYTYEDGYLYMYDDTEDILMLYDESDDSYYYYDEDDDEWYDLE